MAEARQQSDAEAAPAAAPGSAKATDGGVAELAGDRTCTTDELLEKHCPRYFFDKSELFFPIDLNRYCADKSAVPGVNGMAAPSQDGMSTWLIYMNFYLFDGGVATLGGKGGHPYDLEMVVVEIRNSDSHVTGVFYGPHSGHEHIWIRDDNDLDAILGKEKRPKVYVSRGKHASYPVSGKVIRLFGLGTDKCMKPYLKPVPFFPLNEATQNVDKIDGKFSGPKMRITRDWSTAPGTKLKDVKRHRTFPPSKQIRKELGKLKCW